MRIQLAAIAGLVASAQAFKDTSPFLLFSSSPIPSSFQDSKIQLQSRAEVLKNTKEILSSCSSDIYYIIRLDSVSSSQLSAAPHLKHVVSNIDSRNKYTVSDVVGWSSNDGQELANYIAQTCGAKPTDRFSLVETLAELEEYGGKMLVHDYFLGALMGTASERKVMLGDLDAELYTSILKDLSKAKTYTIIYTTTPATDIPAEKPVVYEADFNEPLHLDLKRELLSFDKRAGPTTNDTRPLFEKYNFLSPGLFMGLMVSFLLFSILAVGISAVSSLQVSYGAFDKEMGPAAQKKQQ